VRGQALLAWHVQALAAGGFADLLINTAWLGEQIEPALAPLAAQRGCRIRYSHEGLDFGGALETAGGIARALPHLADVFWVVAGDVYAPQFAFSREAFDRFTASRGLAHLYLVPNPAHNPGGDFGLDGHSQRALNLAAGHPERRYTFSTIALYRREFFAGVPAGNPQGLKLALAPLLRQAMDRGQVSAEVYTGAWTDVGTPERLAELNTV
jgi:MurNAc alpha-1-phosphate uridylyltransferase